MKKQEIPPVTNLEDLKRGEILDLCKQYDVPQQGATDYLIKQLRIKYTELKTIELPAKPKTEMKNLDEESEQVVFDIAKKLTIGTTGKKLERVKQEIRVKWANMQIKELPCMGLAVKKKHADITRNENFTFNHKFTDAEMILKSQQLSQSCQVKQSIESDKKAVMSDFKSRIDLRTAEIEILAREVSSGQEMMTKTCVCNYDFANGVKIYIYGGKEVGRIKMIDVDYQLDVEFPDAK